MMEETTDNETTDNSWATAPHWMQSPDWRWTMAGQFAGCRSKPGADHFDQDARDAAAYRRGYAGGAKSRADERYPHIAVAEALANDPATSEKLKVLVLAACPQREIAKRLGVAEEVVRLWESLFFDVRERLPALDWVLAKVIWPEQIHGSRSLASKLKLAFAGGPVAARAVLELESRVLLTAGERLFDRRLRLELKLDEALAIPLVTSQDNYRFVEFYAELRLSERQLELDKQELEERCRAALRRHELVKLRLQRAS